MTPQPSAGIFRFGVYEVDLAHRELRKSGLRLRLQDQAFQVLVAMLERPAEIVTREELRQKLWPDGTFVDYDHGLNTIINKLRESLSDTAANPKFIETLARRGYRFIAPVQFDGSKPQDNNASHGHAGEANLFVPKTAVLTDPRDLPFANRRNVRFLFLSLQVMYLIFYVTALGRVRIVQDLLEQSGAYGRLSTIVLILTAVIGIPLRLYLISAIGFDISGLDTKFRRLFPIMLVLDIVWAVAPFLLVPQIGIGLALASTAALIYSPFAQRTLILMGTIPSAQTPSDR